jgi:hypothetical protein
VARNRRLARPGQRLNDNIKIDKYDGRARTNSSGTLYEHGNEPSNSLQCLVIS